MLNIHKMNLYTLRDYNLKQKAVNLLQLNINLYDPANSISISFIDSIAIRLFPKWKLPEFK